MKRKITDTIWLIWAWLGRGGWRVVAALPYEDENRASSLVALWNIGRSEKHRAVAVKMEVEKP